jgi:DNA invertase Pin-like site-specific DNA recombinase
MWAGYLRVSSVGGRSGESFRSVEDQRRDIQSYADARGWAVDFLPPDLDEKSNVDDRPSFNVAVRGVRDGTYQGIIVFNYSRFFRNAEMELRYVRELREVGGEVKSTQEDFPADAFGDFMRTINAANNQLFRDQKAEQFRKLTEATVASGKWRGPVVPPGYVKDAATRKLVPSTEAASVKQAFASRSRGVSIPDLALSLGWHPQRVSRMLENRVYLGEVRVGEFVNTCGHPAIVDAAVFDAVQSLKGAAPARSSSPALLSGLVRCESCGYVMGLQRKPKPYYRCKATKPRLRCELPSAISAVRLDDYVSRAARLELSKLQVSARSKGADGEKIADNLRRAEDELAGYLSAVSVSDVGEIAFRRGAKERREKVDAARASLASVRATSALLPVSGDAAEVWDGLSSQNKNLVLRGLIGFVVVRKGVRGSAGARAPVHSRVRVVAAGTLKVSRPLPFPDLDDENVIGVFGR